MDNQKLSERLSELAEKATKGDLTTAEEYIAEEWQECPFCDGSGEVECSRYGNFDGKALGVQFYGIGSEFGAHEALWRELVNALPTIISALQEKDL